MKDGFIYRNPIFISEVKKRLADKRNYRLKTKLIAIDKFPSEESKKNFHLLSNKSSQSNLQYFLNFIKEKGYKSAFTKINETFQSKLNKNKSLSKKKKNIKIRNDLNNVIKIYNGENKDFYYKICIRKYNLINQRQTPFQINHIKTNFLKQYIKFSKRRNSSNNLKNNKSLKSYSINSSGQKIKIFGENRNMIRNLSETKTMNKNRGVIKYRTSYLSKDSAFKKNFYTVKANCYYNRINLRKYCLKPKKDENKEKTDEHQLFIGCCIIVFISYIYIKFLVFF